MRDCEFLWPRGLVKLLFEGFMSTQNSVQDVQDTIIERLIAGQYPQGSKLPSATDLATELGVHRNTVAKAYQFLAEQGVVVSTRGRGTFVADVNVSSSRGNLQESLLKSLEQNIRRARQIGISREHLESELQRLIDRSYEQTLPHGYFVECNSADIEAHISEIADVVRVQLSPLRLHDVSRVIESNGVGEPPLVFTSLFHFREVKDIVADLRPDVDVVGVHTVPTESSLEELASIPAGATVGVIANNPEGCRRIANLVETYSAAETRTRSAPPEDEVRELASRVDLLVCTRDQERVVQKAEPDRRVLVVPFHVSAQSAHRVLEAMLERQSNRRQAT